MRPKRQPVVRLLFVAGFLLLSGLTALLVDAQQVGAYSSYLSAADNQYPKIIGTKLDSCQLCHPSGGYALNPYAQDYRAAGHSFTAIEQADSDKDGFSNIVEIDALRWPGDASDFPAAAATNTPTPTRTNTPPPSSPTFTATPSPTRSGPAATSTPTVPAPSPTATASATVSAPPGSTPTPWPLPAPIQRFAFLGEVSAYPESGGHTGAWRVSGRTVQVTELTWLEQPGLLGEHSAVWVWGMRAPAGVINAAYIRILTQGEDDDEADPPATVTAVAATKTPTPTRTSTRASTPTQTRTPRPSATPSRTPSPTPTEEDDDDARTN